MRKLEIADPEIMRIAIQQEISRSDESRYDHRLHGLLLLTSGIKAANKLQTSLARTAAPFNVGSSASSKRDLKACVKANGQEGLLALTPSNGRLWGATCAEAPRTSGMSDTCGMASCCPHTSSRSTRSLSGCVSASVFFGKWIFRLRKPRPQVAQSDPVLVAAFKKTAPTGKAKRS